MYRRTYGPLPDMCHCSWSWWAGSQHLPWVRIQVSGKFPNAYGNEYLTTYGFEHQLARCCYDASHARGHFGWRQGSEWVRVSQFITWLMTNMWGLGFPASFRILSRPFPYWSALSSIHRLPFFWFTSRRINEWRWNASGGCRRDFKGHKGSPCHYFGT